MRKYKPYKEDPEGRRDLSKAAHGLDHILDRLHKVPARGNRGLYRTVVDLQDAFQVLRSDSHSDENLAEILREHYTVACRKSDIRFLNGAVHALENFVYALRGDTRVNQHIYVKSICDTIENLLKNGDISPFYVTELGIRRNDAFAGRYESKKAPYRTRLSRYWPEILVMATGLGCSFGAAYYIGSAKEYVDHQRVEAQAALEKTGVEDISEGVTVSKLRRMMHDEKLTETQREQLQLAAELLASVERTRGEKWPDIAVVGGLAVLLIGFMLGANKCTRLNDMMKTSEGVNEAIDGVVSRLLHEIIRRETSQDNEMGIY